MKITIIGPGAMGCLFGAFLAKSGEEVWLLDHNAKRAKEIAAQGLKVEGVSGKHQAKIKAVSNPKDIKECELAIVCVKSYDTEAAVRHAKAVIGPTAYVLTLQNGLGNVETISEIVGEERVIAGVSSQGATLLGTGHIRHAGVGDTVIGAWQASGRRSSKKWKISRRALEDIADVFKKAGFKTKVSDKVRDLVWSKLIINVGINALTAITRLNNGRLPEYEGTKQVLKLAVLEAAKVARRKKISLIFSDPIKKVESVCDATGGNISSMLQDALKKRKTEIDYINGAIVREGENLEIQTPVNRVLTDLVKTIEESYEKQLKG